MPAAGSTRGAARPTSVSGLAIGQAHRASAAWTFTASSYSQRQEGSLLDSGGVWQETSEPQQSAGPEQGLPLFPLDLPTRARLHHLSSRSHGRPHINDRTLSSTAHQLTDRSPSPTCTSTSSESTLLTTRTETLAGFCSRVPLSFFKSLQVTSPKQSLGNIKPAFLNNPCKVPRVYTEYRHRRKSGDLQLASSLATLLSILFSHPKPFSRAFSFSTLLSSE